MNIISVRPRRSMNSPRSTSGLGVKSKVGSVLERPQRWPFLSGLIASKGKSVTQHIHSSDAAEGQDFETPATLGGWIARNAVTLGIVAAAMLFAAWKQWDFFLISKVIVGLGFVIFIHELGHFLAAKWCDVHVETFSIGFGPPLPGCRFQSGETVYQVAVVPLGGYVKMVGEGAEEEGEDDPRSFKNKSVG